MTKERPPTIVVVTGPPAAGKTRLAMHISEELGLPMVSKDDVKEALFDTLGYEDRDTSHRLGQAAVESILRVADRLLKARLSVVLEANFDRNAQSENVRRLASERGARLAQVVVTCDLQEAFWRYQQRAAEGERHAGHYDLANLHEWRITGVPPVEPLDLPGPPIVVDTTDRAAVDLDAVVAAVREVIEA